MTFFYDLNKRLAAVNDAPESKQLNERDMSRAAKGYEKYGKEGMQALAKAGREGKSLDPIRNKYDKYDEGAYQAGPDKSQIPAVQRKNDPLTLKDLEKERTQSPTSADGMRALQDKLKNIHPMDEADMEEGNEFSGALQKAKATGQREFEVDGKEYPVKESANDKKPCPPMSHVKKMCQDGKTVAEICKMHPDCDQTELKQMVADCKSKLEEAAKYRDPKYKDKLYTQEPRDYDQYDYGDSDYYNPKPADYPGEKRKIGGSEFDHNDPLQKGQGIGRSGIKNNILDRGPRKGLPSRDQITSLKGSIKDAHGTHAQPNLPEAAGSIDFDKVLDAIAALYGDDMWENDAMQDLANDLAQAGPTDQELDFIIAKGRLPKRLANTQFSAGDNVQFGEAGAPMTAKQKSFAALAEPKDKITFADKIAGAKKEVDEMLGDVAAEAMKSALSGGQKKLDKNKNGKLDAMDFEMLRKGGNKQETSEDDDNNPFTNYKNPRASRAEQPRVGSVTQGAKHDTEWTSTGRKVTRRVDPQGNSVGSETDAEGNTIEKRSPGRPTGPAKAPERTTAKAYKHKGDRKVKEGDMEESADYGQAQQIYNDLADIRAIAKQAQGGRQFPAGFASRLESALWAAMTLLKNQQSGSAQVSEKAPPGEKAERMVKGIKQSLSKDGKLSDKDKSIAYATAWKAKKAGKVEEESTDKEDQHAEKAGKKVAKDIEHDEDHKGKDDNQAEKAGKKVTKDIEYDDKKDKKKEEVEETTTSGSVATSTEAPKKGKGGISFGQGIYDSMNREVEAMISESMSVNISSSTEGGKSITVTATEEDADKLAELLKMAGLGQQSQPCPQCGSSSCGCDEMTEAYGDTDETKNHPDWPTNKEGSDNPFQYSGGLNRPKSTGQTTIPVVASQLDRQRTLESSLEQEFKNFKI